jgi:hypothetical protein
MVGALVIVDDTQHDLAGLHARFVNDDRFGIAFSDNFRLNSAPQRLAAALALRDGTRIIRISAHVQVRIAA